MGSRVARMAARGQVRRGGRTYNVGQHAAIRAAVRATAAGSADGSTLR